MNKPIPTKAYELTTGDIILYLGDKLMVYSEPRYTIKGIEFDALPMAMEGLETQGMCLPLEQLVQLIGHQQTIYPTQQTMSEIYQHALSTALAALRTALGEANNLIASIPLPEGERSRIENAIPTLAGAFQSIGAIYADATSELKPLANLPALQACTLTREGECILIIAPNQEVANTAYAAFEEINRAAVAIAPFIRLRLMNRATGHCCEPWIPLAQIGVARILYEGHEIEIARDCDTHHLWQADIHIGGENLHPAARGCPSPEAALEVAKRWISFWAVNQTNGG